MDGRTELLLTLRWIDPLTEARGYLAFDTVIRGITAGGVRMRPGLDADEVARLARTMTHKFALFEVPLGGAKAGLDFDPRHPEADGVLRRFFEAIAPYLRQVYIPGADLGTDEEQIFRALAHVGIDSPTRPGIYQWDIDPGVVGVMGEALRLEVDGLPLENLITGYGVAQCALEAMAYLGLAVGQARVSIQGFGNVGGAAAKVLHQAGVRVVAVADVDGVIADPSGLDIPCLLNQRDVRGTVDRSGLPETCRLLGSDAWLTEPADVLIPAAISDAVDADEARLVNARIVVEGANMPLSDAAERDLHRRGIVVIPDFLANSGFAFIFGAILLGWVGADADAILEMVADRVRPLTRQVLAAFDEGRLPREQVIRIAEENLKR